jgi:hypothetical protein
MRMEVERLPFFEYGNKERNIYKKLWEMARMPRTYNPRICFYREK